ncbi:unnamed protein product [Caenorhabditis auriculariae]|uniref:Exoribonuclease phosphorolytic domain-containing protein n=1 Tax=Caenorhabditis auriculariae TaxID=2777116 RepID=A0A8S1HB37_9PELO|nr:unnamed protein product [Caenorhabditis auriculariae]
MPTIHTNFVIPLADLQSVDGGEEKMDTGEVTHRSSTAFRPCCIKCGVFSNQDGSGYAEFGNTRVLAQIYGPNSDEKWEEDHAKITVSIKGVVENKQSEMRAQLNSSISAVIFAEKYPGKTIEIEVTVLNDDGGVLAAALIAASLAISHSGIEAMGTMTAAHVGVTAEGDFVTDPSISDFEDRNLVGGVTLCLVPNLNQVTCVDVYGLVPHSRLPSLITTAREKALALVTVIRKSIIANVEQSQKPAETF